MKYWQKFDFAHFLCLIFKVGDVEELAQYLEDLIVDRNPKYPNASEYTKYENHNVNRNPKYPNSSEYNEYNHSVNSDTFAYSDYALQKRKSFSKKSFEIVQNYSYEKDIEVILTALKRD